MEYFEKVAAYEDAIMEKVALNKMDKVFTSLAKNVTKRVREIFTQIVFQAQCHQIFIREGSLLLLGIEAQKALRVK